MAFYQLTENTERGYDARDTEQNLSRRFTLFGNSANDNELSAQSFLFGQGIYKGALHDSGVLAWVRDISVKRRARGNVNGSEVGLWDVEVTYRTGEAPEQQPQDDPFLDEVQISFSVELATKNVQKDLDETLVANAVGDPFLEGLEITYAVPVVRCVRNEPVFNSSVHLTYANKINSATFSGAEPGTVWLRNYAADKQSRNGTPYWSVVYEFAYNEEGWQPELLNEGRNCFGIAGVTSSIKRCTIPEGGREVQQLKEDGTQTTSSTQANFIEFVGFREANFNLLGLPL